VSDLGTEKQEFKSNSLFMDSMDQHEPSIRTANSSLHLVLAITALPRLKQLNGTTIPHGLPQSVRN